MPTSSMPTITVEIAFASDALDTTPTWTDITAYVQSGSIKFGRNDEFDEFQAGRATLVLNNRDRRFDPFYTSGPYYGTLLARKQLRIKTTWNSTTRTQFVGFVSGWGVAPEVHGNSTWTLEAYDGLAYLARVDLPDMLWFKATQESAYPADLQAWWPLGESSQMLQDRQGTYQYVFTSAQPRVGSGSTYVDGSSQVFDGTYGAIGPPIDNSGSSFVWSVSFMVKSETVGPTGGLNPILADAIATNPTTIGIDEYGRLAYRRGASNTAHSGTAITDGNWHFVTVNGSASGAKIYVDGVLMSSGNTTGTGGKDAFAMLARSESATDSPYFTGELQHVAVWDLNGSYETLAAAAIYGTIPDSGGILDNVVDVLDAAGWPSAWRNNDVTTVPAGGVVWQGRTALDVLQELARTENGRALIDRDGTFCFHSGSHIYTEPSSTTSQATYSDSKAAGVVPYSAIGQIVYDDERLINRAIVSTADGVTFTADDTTSQTTYGIRAKSFDTVLKSGDEALTRAELFVQNYANPVLRIDNWTVLPQNAGTTAFPKVLPADLADRVTVEIMPSNVGTRISQQMLIESITHTFDSETWTTTFSGSPAVNAWLLEDAAYGLLESTTYLA